MSISARDASLIRALTAMSRQDAEPVIVRRPAACCECTRYTTDPINPAGGLGNCAAGHGHRYPGQCPQCPDFKASA